MIKRFHNRCCEEVYRKYNNYKTYFREKYHTAMVEGLHFSDDDISVFPEVKEELEKLGRIFSGTFPAYCNFYEMVRLAVFLKDEAILLKELPLQLNCNPIVYGELHHNPELTQLIVSQLPNKNSISFGGGGYIGGADITSENTMVEVGDTRVSMVEEYLQIDKEIKVWVIPLTKVQKVLALIGIYEFTRGQNWEFVDRWKTREKNDDDEYRRKIIQNIEWY